MGFGTGIFLITAGAILAFAIKVDLWWVDVEAVGVVFMLSGVVVLVVAAWEAERRRPARWVSTVDTSATVVPVLPPAAQPPPPPPAAITAGRGMVDTSRARTPAAVGAAAPVTGPPPPTPTPPTPEQPPMPVPPAD